jgi:hypothetical protein
VQARRLYDRGVPLCVVVSASLLASLRRMNRPADGPRVIANPLAGLVPVRDRRTEFSSPTRQTTLQAATSGGKVLASSVTRSPLCIAAKIGFISYPRGLEMEAGEPEYLLMLGVFTFYV